MTAPPTADRMLSLREVSKAYRGGKKANDAVSLDLRPGELVALLGHNGAGKSTLLKQIIGVLKPSSGSITYGPLDFVADPASARLYAATMPQDYSPLEGVTPYQAITSIAKIRGMHRRRARAAAEDLIELLDIAAWRDIRGTKLSSGLRRLTSYAMATVARTEILLIDEPTNDVDPPRRELLWSHLRGLADEGRIVFVVTHNLMEVQRVADRCVLMDQGRIVTDLGSEDFAERMRTASLEIDFPHPVDVPPAPPVEHATVDAGRRRAVYSLALEDAPAATAWVVGLVARGEASGYRLSPPTLESLYKEYADDH